MAVAPKDALDVAELVNPVIEGTLTALAPSLTKQMGKAARGIIDSTVVALQLGFSEYLSSSYDRCRVFKTILNPQQPVDVLSHYINVTLTCANKTLKDDVIISNLSNYKRIVVTGLAGSGKSMFMKYMTIRQFLQPSTSIPVFVELRHMNDLTERNLLAFIRTSCTSKNRDVSADQFELALRAGAFTLILDGFDEINREYAHDLERQILDIERQFPRTVVVVSSRPDSRFASWRSFYEFGVDELSKSQTIKLIESLEYTPAVKRRFLREVKARLFETHASFLKYPLLASIMLLTYEEFAEIPQKMHAFYGQAFDTLFQKHDAQKDQFKRTTATGLTREECKRCFSAFCAISYLDAKPSFPESYLNQVAAQSIAYARQAVHDFPSTVTGDNLVEDLFKVVCVLQPDGVEISFVHRSFQEYFAAVFASHLHGANVKKFMDRCIPRYYDSVLPMAVDMAPELMEKEWVIPTIETIEASLFGPASPESVGGKLSKIFSSIQIQDRQGGLIQGVSGIADGEIYRIDALAAVYPRHLGGDPLFRPFVQLTRDDILTRILKPEHAGKPKFEMWHAVAHPQAEGGEGEEVLNPIPFEISAEDDWWLTELGVHEAFEKVRRGIAAVKRDVRSRNRRRTDILEEFL